jgi:uncharacterized membrane protein
MESEDEVPSPHEHRMDKTAPRQRRSLGPLRGLVARPRLVASFVIGLASILLLPHAWVPLFITRALVGWNVASILYLILSARIMFWSSHEPMTTRALQQDEGRVLVLTLVVLAAVMCVGAIVAELGVVKELKGLVRTGHIALALLTIVTSWAFTQLMFALHYAHDYYSAEVGGGPGGLDFPGGHAPDYGDFLYFSCIIGTSGQTADVSITNRRMRRTVLLHCALAFFFNTTLIALTINMSSSLF